MISHGVKPFQGSLFEFDIRGLILISGQSALYTKESDIAKHYFSNSKKVYSDKLAKLVIKCNLASQGMVFKRISNCFKYIYIDEIQDFAGYDLEILDCLFKSDSKVLLVGDPRQATYSTNNSKKNKKYVKSDIVNFFADSELQIETDEKSLTVNHRCFKTICSFSNLLYPDFPPATPSDRKLTGHDGIFALLEEDLESYLLKYNPTQLRDSIKKTVNNNFEVMNFGKSKGLTFNRIVIYPTMPMINWLKDNDSVITRAARAKLYVALTRAKNSVSIVLNKNQIKKITGIEIYVPHGSNERLII